MVSFFSKKIFVVDLLEGIVDIHNHILPSIDDGAQTVEESIDLIKGFSEFGVQHFIATPHIMHNYHDNTPKTIESALKVLQDHLRKHKMTNVVVDASAEHMIDDNFESILEQKGVMPMRRDYLLVEMSYLQRPINFDEAVAAIIAKPYFPVLAHPERYNFLHVRPRRYGEFKKQGILFQLNLLSLGEFYGKEVQKMAGKLLDDGLIDFIGSDVHNMNQLETLKKLTVSKKTKEILIPIIENTMIRLY